MKSRTPDADIQIPIDLTGHEPAEGLIDLHSHLVPGVDDGAEDFDQALRAIGRLASSGVRHIVTTPHVDATLLSRKEAFEKRQKVLQDAWERVIRLCRDRRPALTFHLGREILLDTTRPDTSDPRVRLAGGPYVLVEYPRLNIPQGSEDVLHYMRSKGHTPVIAHVERYQFGSDREHTLVEWRDAGTVFQVNSASLVGKFGRASYDLAWELLERGWVDLVASDYHARGEPWLVEGIRTLLEADAGEQAKLLYRVNPARILAGEPVLPLEPLERPGAKGVWGRLAAGMRGLLDRD